MILVRDRIPGIVDSSRAVRHAGLISGKSDNMYTQRPSVAGITTRGLGLAVVVLHPRGS